MISRKRTIYFSVGTATLVAIMLTLLFIVTRPTADVAALNVTVPTVTNPATGLQVNNPAYAKALSNALLGANIPFVVIDTTTIGVNPESMEAAKQALVNPNDSGQPFEYSVVTTNVNEPATIPPVDIQSPINIPPDTPIDFVPISKPANSENLPNQSQVDFLPRGELKDLNQTWSTSSTLANSNYLAMFAIFPNAQVAQAASNWMLTSVDLGNALAAGYWSPTTDPAVFMSVMQVPDDVLTSLSNAVNGNVTYKTEVGLAFIVDTQWTQLKAVSVAKTLPLPMIVTGLPNSPILQYLGQTPTLKEFNELGEALKKAGMTTPLAVGFS